VVAPAVLALAVRVLAQALVESARAARPELAAQLRARAARLSPRAVLAERAAARQ